MSELDCCFTRNKNWFRYRAAGIIVEEGRTLFITSGSINYFYSVGGGVHLGETSEECVKREVFEETGVHYEIDHLAIVIENFFRDEVPGLQGLDCHCLEFYYLMKPRGSMELNSDSVNACNDKEIMRWLPVDKIKDYNIKPSCLKDRFDEIVNSKGIIHIVSGMDD